MGTDERMAEVVQEPDIDTAVEVANGKDADAEAAELLEWDHDAPIALRLFRTKREIGFIDKDKTANIKTRKGSNFSYDYISHDNVALKSRVAFDKHGVLPWPTVLEREDDGNKTKLKVRVEFINVDKPDDILASEVWGDGVDESDKAPGKAYSYAVKNAILKALQLNTGEDIEADDTKHEIRPSDESLAKEKAGAADAVKAWADNFNSAIRGVTSSADLKEVRRNNREMLLSQEVPQVTKDYFHNLLEEAADQLAKDGV